MTEMSYGLRPDKTPKGHGFFGPLPAKELGNSDEMTATELSYDVDVDGENLLIPMLVPTLTRQEIDYLLAGNEPTPEIVQKAVDHAVQRRSQGKSPFADDGAQFVPLPASEEQAMVQETNRVLGQ